jgi:hypothetical protein
VSFDAQRIVLRDNTPQTKYFVLTFSCTDSVRGGGPDPGSQSALHISTSRVRPRARICAPLAFEPQFNFPFGGYSRRRRSV